LTVEEEDFELVEKRLEAISEEYELAVLEIGEISHIPIKKALEHVRARDKIGELLVRTQMHYLRSLKRRV